MDRRGLRPLWALLWAALVVPPAAIVVSGWQLRDETWRAAGVELQRGADALHEYMLRILQTQSILLTHLNTVLGPLDDAAVLAQQDDLHRHVVSFVGSIDQVNSINVSDADGYLLVSSIMPHPPRDISFADRPWHRALAVPAPPDMHISEVLRGRIDGSLFFGVSRRRSAPGTEGRFAGAVVISVDPGVLSAGLARLLTQPTDRVAIWRDDAMLLARHPPLEQAPDRPLEVSPGMRMAMIAGREAASPPAFSRAAADGAPRLSVVRKVGPYPVFAAIGREVAAIDAVWHARLREQLAFRVPAWIGLVGLAGFALSRSRRAQDVAARLAEEQARREGAEALARAEARFRGVFDSRAIGMAVLDTASGTVVAANDRVLELVGQSRDDFERRGLAWEEATPPEWLPRDHAALAQAAAKGFWDAYEKEYRHADGTEVAVRISSAPLPNEPGLVVVLVEDISAQRVAEARRDLLAREIEHRARNTLTLVQVILRTSLAGIDELTDELSATVQGRIAALARSQGLLSQRAWTSADLRDLMSGELAVFTAGDAARIALDGPSVAIAGDAVQPLSMALHELATNAAKYGALSSPGGRLVVAWAIDAEGLRITWTERGGPPVDGPPQRQGFGSQLLRATIGIQLRGKVDKIWAREGITCVLWLPAAALAPPDPTLAAA
jgi:PAS domain S-box-containing protein